MEREELIEMSRSFQISKILVVASEFDLFTILSGRPMTASMLSDELKADASKIELLLNALVALGLLEKHEDSYKNSQVAEDFLVIGREGYIGNMLKRTNSHWDAWNGLEIAIFGRRPELNWSEIPTFSMEENSYKKAAELAENVDLTGKRRLLDVGGGSGAYSAAFVGTYPGLEAAVFDLPEPIKVTKRLLEEKGMGDRVKTIEGDFEVDDLGSGFDCILISNIMHFQDEKDNKRLLKKAHNALQEGGAVIIHGPILDEGKTSPKNAAIFSIHMLLKSDGGRTYAWSEIEAWLEEAGFVEPGRTELTESRVIVAVAKK